MALSLAQDADLDLVEVAPDARPPVAKLMDFGKFKYESDMKAREARRNQANTVLKEIRFRLKIDPHDYGTKKGHVERFLKAGDKVKVMIMFRGREQSRPEMGIRLLQRLAEDVVELGFVESSPKQDGRNMTMVLGPTKKKADAKSEQRRRAEEAEPRLTKSAAKAAAAATVTGGTPAEELDEVLEAPAAEELLVEVVETAEAVADAPAAPTEPAAPEPAAAAAEPTPEPAAAEPTPEPAAPKAATKPAAAPRPATPPPARPAAAKSTPAAARPAATKPAAAKPTTAPKPAVVAKPAVPRPAVPRPAAPRPAPPKPAPRSNAG